MKIKAILIASALVVSGAAFAQETNVDESGKLRYGPYETNKFWDNWFIDAGAGINYTTDNLAASFRRDATAGNYGGGLAIEVAVGKWFTPCWGARIGWSGLRTGDVVNNTWSAKPYNYIHFDALMNASHLFAGYKQYRAVNVIPYLSFGGIVNNRLAGGLGCMLNVRLSDVVGFVADFRGIHCHRDAFGNNSGRRLCNFSATLGLQFNLGKNSWMRKSTSSALAAAALATATAANSELQAKNSQLAAEAASASRARAQLAKENEDLKNELARAAASKKAVNLAETPVYAYFEIGKATLSDKELAHLEYNVKTAIAQNNDVVLTITGNADSKTGSKKRNAKLSQQRADYLYKILTEKYGLDAKNFTVKSNGGNDIFKTPALNRAAIVSK